MLIFNPKIELLIVSLRVVCFTSGFLDLFSRDVEIHLNFIFAYR